MPQLVVGLGNPGLDYAESRHNTGFWVADRLAQRFEARWRRRRLSQVARLEREGLSLILAKPTTYMNLSGTAVAQLMGEFALDPSRLIVVYDDIDLPVGKVRVRRKGGHGGHHGVQSVIEALGSQMFRRVKIGIGRPATKDAVTDYLLDPLSAEERSALEEAVERAAETVLALVAERAEED